MPTIHIVKESQVVPSFRVEQIRGMFDFDNLTIRHEWNSSLPVERKEWGIGLIVGASGSGKTTLAKEAFQDFYFHENFDWPASKSFVDGFSEESSTKDIVGMLNAVGFSSPPHWLKPFAHLSNGQKFRAELARCLLLDAKGVIFDEFTSVVDRDVAKIGCAAISKTLRKKGGPPFVAVSCHYDIIDWLDPDWVFDVGTQQFEWRGRRRRPEIVLNIYETSTAAWSLFREHHYLNHDLSKSARCFVATWNDKPVAFCSALHFPHARCSKFKREHRTVVLPDFQGVGIGNRVSEFVARKYVEAGFRFISTTSAPAMIAHRVKSKNWKLQRIGRSSAIGKTSTLKSFSNTVSKKRITAGFEFIMDATHQ
jgi:energy-coupling factor transporter ATP-binding protein EcfA2